MNAYELAQERITRTQRQASRHQLAEEIQDTDVPSPRLMARIQEVIANGTTITDRPLMHRVRFT